MHDPTEPSIESTEPTYPPYPHTKVAPYTYADYVAIPPPPPPLRKNTWARWWVIVLVVLAMAIIFGGTGFAVASLLLGHQNGTSNLLQPTNKTTPIPTSQPTPTAPAYVNELSASDFPTFLSAFSQAMNAHDYDRDSNSVATATDIANFKLICYAADTYCSEDWQQTRSFIDKGELSFSISKHPYIENYISPGAWCYIQDEKGVIYVEATYISNTDLSGIGMGSNAMLGFFQQANSTWLWTDAMLNINTCYVP